MATIPKSYGLFSLIPEEKRKAITCVNYVGLAKSVMCALQAFSDGKLDEFDPVSVQDYQCQMRALITVLSAKNIAAEEISSVKERLKRITKPDQDGDLAMTAKIRRMVVYYLISPADCQSIYFRRNDEETGVVRVFDKTVNDRLAFAGLSKSFAQHVRSYLIKESSRDTIDELAAIDPKIRGETLEQKGRMIPHFAYSVELFLQKAIKEKIPFVLGLDFAANGPAKREEITFASEGLWRAA